MITIGVVLILLAILYLYGTKNFSYWKKRNVKHDKPIFLFGNNAPNFFLQKSISEVINEMYWKYPKEKIVGFFRASRPEIIIRDPEIVKQILVTDFKYFYARGMFPNQKSLEPVLRNLFFADGDLWRLLRQRLTPAFTNGKLKAMFPLIVERAERLQDRAMSLVTQGNTIDARELMARYTTDFIGACGFGIDADSLNEEDSEFRKLGASVFQFNAIRCISVALKQLIPDIFHFLRPFDHIEKGVNELVDAILKERNYEPSDRNDFVDLMIEIKKKGTITCDSIEHVKFDGTPEIASLELDRELIAAQVFIFFVAGFETSSSATSFTLHQLAFNPEAQKKAQAEIDEVLKKHKNKLSYDAVREMTYLGWTLKEGLRVFPSLAYLTRKCAGKYSIPNTDVTVDESVHIHIPLQALHMDPLYFDNPEQFRPERFDTENFTSAQKSIYLPFGIGPRACIGQALGTLQSLAGLAAILSKFTVEPAPETIRYPILNPRSNIVQCVTGGIMLKFKERV